MIKSKSILRYLSHSKHRAPDLCRVFGCRERVPRLSISMRSLCTTSIVASGKAPNDLIEANSGRSAPQKSSDQNLVIERYNLYVDSKQIRFDEHQYDAVLKLNKFYQQLMRVDESRIVSARRSNELRSFNFFFNNFMQLIDKDYEHGKNREKLAKIKSIKSVYLYGGVGKFLLLLLLLLDRLSK